MPKNRVAVFVDGFNLYHAIDDLDKDPVTHRHKNIKHYLKWLDIKSLSKALIHPANDELVSIYYFSAFAKWVPEETQKRHHDYVAALRDSGVMPVMGTFKIKPRKCPNCRHGWDGHEEKESDVNIAVYLVKLAYENQFDKAIVFTADTDIAPAIRIVRNAFPGKEVKVAIPEKRLNKSAALENAASGKIRLKESHFEKNLLPEKIVLPSGVEIIRPKKYQPPANKS